MKEDKREVLQVNWDEGQNCERETVLGERKVENARGRIPIQDFSHYAWNFMVGF